MNEQITNSETNTLLIHIEHSKPVEVDDFANTLHSLNKLYMDYANRNGFFNKSCSPKLYVEKVEKGSIDIFLTECLPALALPFIENAALLCDFFVNLKSVIEYFTKGKGEEPDLNIEQIKNICNVLNVTAHDKDSITTIGTIDAAGNTFNNCTFNFGESNSAQNQLATKEKELSLLVPDDNTHERVLLTIYQIRNDDNSKTGNKGIIEQLYSDKKVNLLFASEDIRDRILHSNDNPTHKGYYIDVKVHFSTGRVAAYEILKIHDIIDLEDH